MTKEFENHISTRTEIRAMYEAASSAQDAEGIEKARLLHRRQEEELQGKSRTYLDLLNACCEAKENGNDVPDIDGVVWDDHVPELIETMRECGIGEFTYSATCTGAIRTAMLFTGSGCAMTGVRQINGERADRNGTRAGKAALVFTVNKA